jgi:hypothetical protein
MQKKNYYIYNQSIILFYSKKKLLKFTKLYLHTDVYIDMQLGEEAGIQQAWGCPRKLPR